MMLRLIGSATILACAVGTASGQGLASLPQLRNAETRSISAENPTGERGGGARMAPTPLSGASALGTGWKVSPDIVLPRRRTVTIADIQGPGVIQHIWITVSAVAYRDAILRIYWDGEKEPSVESPVGDFFANAHGMRYPVNSLMIAVNPSGGFNSYWPMPFRKRARITVENQRPEDIPGFFYQITYSLEAVPDDAAYFHASWRRSMTTRSARSIRSWTASKGRATTWGRSSGGSSFRTGGGAKAR